MSVGNLPTASRGGDNAYLAELIQRDLPLSAVQRMSGRAMSDVQLIADSLRIKPPARIVPAVARRPPITYAWPADNEPPIPGSMARIFWDTAKAYKVAVADLVGDSRKKEFIRPRHEAMWLCGLVRLADGSRRFSDGNIGRFCGGRDHTTVLNGRRRHAARIGAAAE